MQSQLASHPHAQAVLGPGLKDPASLSHAYLFHGPCLATQRTATQAFIAQLLAGEGAADITRIATGSHPDCTWVTPSGAHEVLRSDIDQAVVSAATRSPFEADRRVFVIERAERLNDEAANRLLKTLEQPASFVHLVLLTERLGEMLPTIKSRCQLVRFSAPEPQTIADELTKKGNTKPITGLACAKLALGSAERAGFLASPAGITLRTTCADFTTAVIAGEVRNKVWNALLELAQTESETQSQKLAAELEARLEFVPRKERKRFEREHNEAVKRHARRTRTVILEQALELITLWFRDVICVNSNTLELIYNCDRQSELVQLSGKMSLEQCQAALTHIEQTRRSLQLNVTEELALEALAFRLTTIFTHY